MTTDLVQSYTAESDAADSEPALKRRKFKEDSDIDMTPMIDMTFLLLIFFLVASTPSDPKLVIDLPGAINSTAVNVAESVTISVADSGTKAPAVVYLADGKVGQPLQGDWASQETAIREHIEAAQRNGKRYVILKAEKGIKIKEVGRVGGIASSVEGMTLHVAVMDRQE